jgi:membrane associated rhomboid family serine protease
MLADRHYMREAEFNPRQSVVLILIIANTAVYALQLLAGLNQGLSGNFVNRYFALVPDDLARGWVWQLITFQFLHGGAFHLIMNCLMLWMFGRSLEETLGRSTFLKLYFTSGTLGGLLQVLCGWTFPSHFGAGAVVGASAGVFGLIAAFAALNWEQRITTLVAFILPVTMRAKYLLLILGILAVLGMLERASGIAHAAHLGGMLAGMGYVHFIIKGNLRGFVPSRPARYSARRELVRSGSPRRTFWRSEPSGPAEELPPAEFISREVDPILDKISAHGIQSLTDREKRILEAARARMATR